MSDTRKTGLAALNTDHFDLYQAIGGVRGIIESIVPGLVFLTVFLVTANLKLTVVCSGALALLQLVLRVILKQSFLGALTGVFAVFICLVWAWLSKDARNYYLPGFITNAVWIVGLGLSLVLRIPGIGLIVEFLRKPVFSGLRQWLENWRQDQQLYLAYRRATFLWILMFLLRMVIQLPLYLTHKLTWLGSTRLVMGLPMFALVIWVSWLLIAQPYHNNHGNTE